MTGKNQKQNLYLLKRNCRNEIVVTTYCTVLNYRYCRNRIDSVQLQMRNFKNEILKDKLYSAE